MIQWRRGVVLDVRSRWAGAIEYAVRLDSGRTVPALGYVDAVGDLHPGTTVLLNTTALERGLGTGGLALAVAAPEALPTRWTTSGRSTGTSSRPVTRPARRWTSGWTSRTASTTRS